MSTVTLRQPEDLLAALPSFFGFHPTESLVVIALAPANGVRARCLGTFRFDLPDITTANPLEFLTQVCSDKPVHGLITVITHDHRGPLDGENLPYRTELTKLTTALAERGFTVLDQLFLPNFTPGITWSCYQDPAHTGVLPDVMTSESTVATIANGGRIFRNRDDIATLFTRGPAEDRARVGDLAAPIVRAVELEQATSDYRGLRARLDRLDAAVETATRGQHPTDHAVIADLSAAITAPLLRDAVLSPDSPQHARAAADLWLHLWRLAPPGAARHLAAMIAMSAYLRGESALAYTAIETSGDPTSLAQLTRACLDRGESPVKPCAIYAREARRIRATLAGDPVID